MLQTIYASRPPDRPSESVIRLPSTIFQTDSIICNIALGELKVDDLTRQALVNLRICIESVIHTSSFLLVKYHLEHFAGILLGTGPLTNNLNRVDEVMKNGVMNS